MNDFFGQMEHPKPQAPHAQANIIRDGSMPPLKDVNPPA
jgi:hypothetical protein